jgi:hypothetical protein
MNAFCRLVVNRLGYIYRVNVYMYNIDKEGQCAQSTVPGCLLSFLLYRLPYLKIGFPPLSLSALRALRASQGVSPPRLRVVRVPRGTRDKTHCLARRTRHIYVSLHTSHSPPPIALINHAPREIILHVDSYV